MFIEVTVSASGKPEGEKQMINLQHVADIKPYNGGSMITFSLDPEGNYFYNVKESYEDVRKKVAFAQGRWVLNDN